MNNFIRFILVLLAITAFGSANAGAFKKATKLGLKISAVVVAKNSVKKYAKPVTSKAKEKIVASLTEKMKKVTLSRTKYPESAKHADDAINAGKPNLLTVNRAGAAQRRKEAMKKQSIVKGKDRDEYPPAMFKEGGKQASVRPINPRDNRGAGSCIGHQCRGLKDGDKVIVDIID